MKKFVYKFSLLETKLNDLFPKVIREGASSSSLKNEWSEIHYLWVEFRAKYRIARFFLNEDERSTFNELWNKIDEIDESLRSENPNYNSISNGFKRDIPELLDKFANRINFATK